MVCGTDLSPTPAHLRFSLGCVVGLYGYRLRVQGVGLDLGADDRLMHSRAFVLRTLQILNNA